MAVTAEVEEAGGAELSVPVAARVAGLVWVDDLAAALRSPTKGGVQATGIGPSAAMTIETIPTRIRE
ncbi:MAG: hypothetical protein CMJ31_08355 [Phycisphaerae bacterium]|nr:hypothetical protein [Phycisphaerae bacterium]